MRYWKIGKRKSVGKQKEEESYRDHAQTASGHYHSMMKQP